jgi:hypothetical protein
MAMKLEAQWIVGFTDGEGCFHVGLNMNPKLRFGYQILPEFVLVQHERDLPLLHAVKTHFGCGIVRRVRYHLTGDLYVYRVRSTKHLDEIIIPFFEKYALKTQKRLDFFFFKEMVRKLIKKDHLDLDSFNLMVERVRKFRNPEMD